MQERLVSFAQQALARRTTGAITMAAFTTLSRSLLLLAPALLLSGGAPMAGVPHARTSGEIASFDAPGAGTGRGQGTIAVAISKSGTIAGGFADPAGTQHGFLLDPFGNFTTFDAPGAAHGTFVSGFNEAGTVIGSYSDAGGVTHGFSRVADGTFTELTGPGGTPLLPAGIGSGGAITGAYADIGGLDHGFRLAPNGKLRAFEAQGAGILTGQGTRGLGINGAGQIVGIYTDLDDQQHPYFRTRDGGFQTLSPPGKFVNHFSYEYPFLFVPPIAINANGAVAGNYVQAIQDNPYGGDINGFIQTPEGQTIVFGIGDSGPCCIFTYVTGLNAAGTAIGYDNDYYNLDHGYVRTPDGTITVFDAPGAGTQYYQGTLPTAINAAGFITGTYQDENYVFHGFVRQP